MQLRDIFRVHPDTSCNTHDLIECPCINASGSDLSIAEKATSDSDTDSIGESSDEEEEGTVKGFVAASQVKTEDIMRMDKAVSVTAVMKSFGTNGSSAVPEEEESPVGRA